MSQSLLQSTYSNPFLRGGSETPFKNFWKIVVFVLVAHILIWIVGKYGLPEFKVKKKADITIELSAAPVSSATPTPPQPQQKPTPPQTQEKSPDAVQKAPVEQPQPSAPARLGRVGRGCIAAVEFCGDRMTLADAAIEAAVTIRKMKPGDRLVVVVDRDGIPQLKLTEAWRRE